MKKVMLFFLFLWIHCAIFCQPYHEDVLKGLEGQELFLKLIENYKPSITMSYGMARDTLYSKIDIGPNNTLEGIYSGFTISLNPALDPTTDAFDKGINAEHSYPQSKGAGSGLGRSDLHHLYPSKVEVNSDRRSYPFSEINDNDTDFWYVDDIKSSNIPGSNINDYSELDLNGDNSRFEPRESVKGNIARSIFYFYTIYREEAVNADPDFFEIQRLDLCDWHFMDPVDEKEWLRTFHIGNYQDNKPNPFVLDCSLASRLYCDETSTACDLLSSIKVNDSSSGFNISNVYPNPLIGSYINVSITSDKRKNLSVVIVDINQQIHNHKEITITNIGPNIIQLPSPSNPGMYFIHFEDENGLFISKKFVKI